ncbi:unnamed protein product [Soboliphyme baturini]|uniref:CDT1 domain-containing protein n=1 Tax=Soboliphyme baturini TaxID=241478 RepID=A0A183J9R4_9BILA|nr:unnamed protein product [Soboliphyme baturini]
MVPCAEMKNEMCFALFDKRPIVREIEAVPSFDTGSDHRLVRMRATFEKKIKSKVLQMENHMQQPKALGDVVGQPHISNEV